MPTCLPPTTGRRRKDRTRDADHDERIGPSIEFMDDQALHGKEAQRELFDPELDVPRARVDWYHQIAEFRTEGDLNAPDGPTLLTVEQERVLFLRFNYARMRAERARRGGARSLEELRQWQARAMEIREQIAEYNLGLVLAMAKRAAEPGLDLSELVSEGNLALLRAIDKFRVSRGYKFSTYACNAILHALGRLRKRTLARRRRFCASYEPDYDRSDHQEVKVEQHERDCVDELRRILANNTSELSDTEKRIIAHRFFEAQDDGRRMTLVEVGRQIGMTKERVRQIQNRALAKLRARLEEDYLDPMAGALASR